MADDFQEWEWGYTTIVGYPAKGGLDKLISVMMRKGWEVVEGTRTLPQEKASPGKSISDGSVQMRRQVPVQDTLQTRFNFDEKMELVYTEPDWIPDED